MTGRSRPLVLAALTTLGAMVPGAVSWACVGVVSLTSSSTTVQPGGTLTITAREFAAKVPVDVHLDSPTGPILVTAPGPDGTMNSRFTIDVPIPANIPSGEHFLVATQDHHDMNSGQPARAVFYVGAAPPARSGPAARPVGLESASGPSLASLLLIALGVAVVGLLLAGAWTLLGARRTARTEPEVVK